MQYEKRTSHAVLFHQVLTLQNFAKFEFFKKKLSQLFIFNQVSESKVSFKTF